MVKPTAGRGRPRGRLGGRRPNTDAYVHDIRPFEIDVVRHVWNCRYVTRRQLLDMFWSGDSLGEKELGAMSRKGLLAKETLPDRHPATGRPLRLRRHDDCPQVDRYLDGRTALVAVGQRGFAILEALGFVQVRPSYETLSIYPRHDIGVVEVWRELEDAAAAHGPAGYGLNFYGYRETRQLIKRSRDDAVTPAVRPVWPDAFFTVWRNAAGGRRDLHCFLEVDMGSEESLHFLPKIDAYDEWWRERHRAGGFTWEFLPPMPVFPTICIVAANRQRQEQIQGFLLRAGKNDDAVDGPRFLVTNFATLEAEDPFTARIWWYQYARQSERGYWGRVVSIDDLLGSDPQP